MVSRLEHGGQTVPVLFNLQVVTLCTSLGLRRIMQVPWLRYCSVCFLFLSFFLSRSLPLFLLDPATAATCYKSEKTRDDRSRGCLHSQRKCDGRSGLPFSPQSVKGQGDALGKGSGKCELQVGLFSTSLLASATHVSHGMRRHQIFSEHAAKKEEWCPPGQRGGTLKWSSAAHKCRRNKTMKNKS